LFLKFPEITFFLLSTVDIVDIIGIEVDDIAGLAPDLIVKEFLLFSLQLHLCLHIGDISPKRVHLI
jgi:hypothetical protein